MRLPPPPQWARDAVKFYNDMCKKLKKENGGKVAGMFDCLGPEAGPHLLALHQNALKVWMADHPRDTDDNDTTRPSDDEEPVSPITPLEPERMF